MTKLPTYTNLFKIGIGGLICLLIVLAGSFALAQAPQTIVIPLSNTWRFATDPNNIGVSQHWYSNAFGYSSWQTLLSGQSWESQSIDYSGYAWYGQQFVVPESAYGIPIQLNLAPISSDDDVWFNGFYVGGLQGAYKYRNMLNRQYTVPASYIKYGSTNTLVIRTWGGNFGLFGANSGLVAGAYTIVMDPFSVAARVYGGSIASETPIALFDLSSAQQGNPFELVFRFPNAIFMSPTSTLTYAVTDFYGMPIANGAVQVTPGVGDGIARGIVPLTSIQSQQIYFAGRFIVNLSLNDAISGTTISNTSVQLDHLSFFSRDHNFLPPLAASYDNTPYGILKLVDSIDCSTPLSQEAHPYMQSAFGDHRQDYMTPGAAVNVPVVPILGKNARVPDFGWFAYRIGRGRLTSGKSYLLRIEYPEDTPRYSTIEIQSGHNYMDVGWKNGLSPTDPYGNWPLSNAWQFFDTIITLGDETAGAGGADDNLQEAGVWVYVMNKMKPGYYFKDYGGGPAIGAMRLYEIDPVTNAPAIILPPPTLPQRLLMFDWERQAEQKPADVVNYAKLMGYNAVSPIMLKWALENWGDPINGYTSTNEDSAGYWVINNANPAQPAIPGLVSVHQQYLAATRNLGMGYIPRIEYGGSANLPSSSWAVNSAGGIAQPN